MKKTILLVSADNIKTYSSLSDNIFDKYILPAIETAQDIELQQTIGTCLYETLKSMVEDGSISDEGNHQYKYLLDELIQPYLRYVALSHLVFELSTKMTNFGAVVSNDEHLENLDLKDRDILRQQYTYYSDAYQRQMQRYLRMYRDLFPELKDCDSACDGTIKPNLDSAEDCGLWLGGNRYYERRH